jgi:hypothetical protein
MEQAKMKTGWRYHFDVVCICTIPLLRQAKNYAGILSPRFKNPMIVINYHSGIIH